MIYNVHPNGGKGQVNIMRNAAPLIFQIDNINDVDPEHVKILSSIYGYNSTDPVGSACMVIDAPALKKEFHRQVMQPPSIPSNSPRDGDGLEADRRIISFVSDTADAATGKADIAVRGNAIYKVPLIYIKGSTNADDLIYISIQKTLNAGDPITIYFSKGHYPTHAS